VLELTQLTPVFDVLRRRRPDLATSFTQRYPELRDAFEGRRILGDAGSPSATSGAAIEVAKAVVVEAKADLNDVLGVLNRRTKSLARLRLAAGIVTALSSAGMLVTILGKDARAQAVAAGVAFFASLLGLIGGYIEDFSGGDGSIRGLRDKMTSEVRQLAEIEGKFRLAFALNDLSNVSSGLAELSKLLGEVQFARAQLGLSI
jgi:hypothetical protein